MGMRGASEQDKTVGIRVRQQRIAVGMSQTELGSKVGVTFQQIQKYENGVNRIGAGRLSQIGNALGVPPSFFFDAAARVSDPKLQSSINDFVSSREGQQIMAAYAKLKPKMRKALKNFIILLAS